MLQSIHYFQLWGICYLSEIGNSPLRQVSCFLLLYIAASSLISCCFPQNRLSLLISQTPLVECRDDGESAADWESSLSDSIHEAISQRSCKKRHQINFLTLPACLQRLEAEVSELKQTFTAEAGKQSKRLRLEDSGPSSLDIILVCSLAQLVHHKSSYAKQTLLLLSRVYKIALADWQRNQHAW